MKYTNIYSASCNYIFKDTTNGLDMRFIEATSKGEASKIYELLLAKEGKTPNSWFETKGYSISQIVSYTEDDVVVN